LVITPNAKPEAGEEPNNLVHSQQSQTGENASFIRHTLSIMPTGSFILLSLKEESAAYDISMLVIRMSVHPCPPLTSIKRVGRFS
jgi:hypothetical protein